MTICVSRHKEHGFRTVSLLRLTAFIWHICAPRAAYRGACCCNDVTPAQLRLSMMRIGVPTLTLANNAAISRLCRRTQPSLA